MQPFSATLQLAGRAVTVRELAMPDFRNLLFAEELATVEADANAATLVAGADAADANDTALTHLADNFLVNWLRTYLVERDISVVFIVAMSSATEADLLQARFSEIDALISKIKLLNAPFFALFRRPADAAEPIPEATAPAALASPPPALPPSTPLTSASVSNDPLLHSLGMVMQAHGTTPT